ncbi:MAG: glycosyltransferase family 4 protein [Muribaculaceae bacterium]|nr:glycosyltransferase family 4 protein [Muribaculaceae bacterium]
MSDKKILIVNNGYPTNYYPDYTTYIRDITKCLSKAGFNVETLVIEYHKETSSFYKLRKYLQYWYCCISKRGTYDSIYINHFPYAWPIAFNPFLRRKNTIIHWHGNDLVGKSILSLTSSLFLKKFIRNSINIVPSQYFSIRLRKKYPNLKHKIHISPSGGVDTVLFSADVRPWKDIKIGFASALTAEKGAETLIYLIEHKHEIESATGHAITFHIINYGKESGYYIDRMLQTDGSSCKIFERMAKKEMPSFYQTIDLLVFPSPRESLGLAALEALSCGVPVVAHNVCAFPEFVKPGVSGELVEPFDTEIEQNQAFLTAVVKAIKNIDSYTPRKVVEANYSQAAVTAFYRQLFETL